MAMLYASLTSHGLTQEKSLAEMTMPKKLQKRKKTVTVSMNEL